MQHFIGYKKGTIQTINWGYAAAAVVSPENLQNIFTIERKRNWLDHDDQPNLRKVFKMLQTITKLYVHCTKNNTYTPRVPLSSGKFVSCSAEVEGEGEKDWEGGA